MKNIRDFLKDPVLYRSLKKKADELENKSKYIQTRAEIVKELIPQGSKVIFAFSMLCTEHLQDIVTTPEFEFFNEHKEEMAEHFKNCML